MVLVSYMNANRKRIEFFDSHLYKFLKSSNFPKSVMGNKDILKRLRDRHVNWR